MKSFNQFLYEELQVTLNENELRSLHNDVDRHIKNGEIVKPEYERLKNNIDRHIRNAGEELAKAHTHGRGQEHEAHVARSGDEHFHDLVYGIPSSSNEVLQLKNKLAKSTSKDHPLHKALTAFHKEHGPLAEKMKHLKTLVKTTTQKRQEKKEVEAKSFKKEFGDTSHLHKVLTQHIDEYKHRAHKMAGQQYDQHMKELEKHGWDLDKAAPKPHTGMGHVAYRTAMSIRHHLQGLTVGSEGKDHIRRPSKEIRAEHQAKAKQAAHDSYMAWVHKLTKKIGKPTKHAEMTGDPWTGSHLHVKTHDGEDQHWHTKMILNQSKYQRLFNQFPTRRKK